MNADRLINAMTPANIEALARAICVDASIDPEVGWQDHREEARRLMAVAVGATEATEAKLAAATITCPRCSFDLSARPAASMAMPYR